MRLTNLTKENLYEHLLYFVLTCCMLIPIFAHKVFFTHDGAAHLYNSQIIKALITGQAEFYESFFRLNTFAEPNWTGHAFLVGLLFFVKPFVAEKILLVIYVVGFCYGFRYWIKSFPSVSPWLPFLIFPFVFSAPLYVGFYNFCLGLALLFLISGYWIRHAKNATWRNAIVLFLLFVLAYFTHITTFAVTVIFISAYTFFSLLSDIIFHKQNTGAALLRYKFGIIALLPVLLLSVTFFVKHGGGNSNSGNSFSEKLKTLFEVAPLNAYHVDDESPYSTRIGLVILVLFLCALLNLLWAIKKNGNAGYKIQFNGWKSFAQLRHVNLLLALFFLVLYFILPNEMSSGGFVSIRLLLLFFLLLLAWLSSQTVSNKLLIPLLFIVAVSTSHLFEYRDGWAKTQNKFVAGLMEMSEQIPEGSVVMPLVESEHWFFLHSSNYLGAVRPAIVLDNYEADTQYFPILWKSHQPSAYFGEPIHQICGEQFLAMEKDIQSVDLILHYNDSTGSAHRDCDISMHDMMDKEFYTKAVSGDGRWRLLWRKP